MHIYVLMIILSLIFSYLFSKTESKKKKILFSILATIPFIIVSSIRYDVGTDYFYRYVPNYITFVEGGTVPSLEMLFRLLIKICLFISKDYAILFILTSIIINVLIFTAIFKFSKEATVSILIYFIGSFFFESMNLVRQFISMAILLVSYKLIFDKKIWWCGLLLIATGFHTVSIIFLISILMYKKVIDYRVVLAIVLILLCLGRPIINLGLQLTSFIDSPNIRKYAHYISWGGNLQLSGLIVETVIYIYIYMIYSNLKKNKKDISKETIFFVNMQTACLICTFMNIHIELFFRIALLFSIFQIISIPHFYYLNKDCKFEIFKNKLPFITDNLKEKLNIVLYVLILLLLFSRMVFANVVKGADEVLPYRTIFSRDK